MGTDDDRGQSLAAKHASVLRELGELEAIQTALSNQRESETDATTQTAIDTYIENLTDIRARMMSEMVNKYANASDQLAYTAGHLANQNSMSGQISGELVKARQLLKSLKAEKNNKRRLAQIGEYEYEKNREHKGIMKTIVYGSFFILIVFFLNKKNMLPDVFTKIIVVAIVVVIILLVIQRLYWNFRRDNIDYSKFSQPNTNRDVGKQRKKPTVKLSKLLGLTCDADINELAKKMANERNSTVAPPVDTPVDTPVDPPLEDFTNMNINTVFPCQSHQCLKYSSI